MKLPSFQFYPGDWMKDPALRSVSLEARGLWIDMLCLLFESGRRGYLQHMTGSSSGQVSRLLQELEDSGVFSRTEHGMIYSRRMIRDERKRTACGEAGRKGGGNPAYKARSGNGNESNDLPSAFKGHCKGDAKGESKGRSKQKPNPSSSTSFSSSKQIPPLPALAQDKTDEKGSKLPHTLLVALRNSSQGSPAEEVQFREEFAVGH